MACKENWNEINMKNMDDFHDHYLKKNVLLLADLFDRCLKFHNLDPFHYFSSPILSWDEMFKMTGIKLESISDIDMYLFIKKGLKGGGISYTDKRYREANNKYVKNYDPRKLSKYIEYLDENNLYGWAMSGHLLYGGIRCNVNSISENSLIGYILKVELYPNELHVLHNDYPLASEKRLIPYDMLSYYCKKFADEYGIKVGDVKKLIPILGDKIASLQKFSNALVSRNETD